MNNIKTINPFRYILCNWSCSRSCHWLLCMLSVCISSSLYAQEPIPKQYLPVDSDKDGIVDDIDECYKTPAGVTVDAIGCPVDNNAIKEINLNINFEFDSAVVQPEFFSNIESVAQFMGEFPLTRVTIEGHADSDGSDVYNKTLSQQRAQAVARVLVKRFQVDPIRVSAVGYGEERPLVANDSEANKRKNRRVVAVIRALARGNN